MEGDGERWKGEKEIRQKKRGDARWMRFHRGPSRRFVLFSRRCRGRRGEEVPRRTRSSNVGGAGGNVSEGDVEGASDAGRAVATPGVR